MSAPRRSQAERRAETIGKLVDATIECLTELGYSKTTVSAICKRAGVSQGALFRHFPTRLDVVVAATEEIGERHIAMFSEAVGGQAVGPDAVRPIVEFIRAATRTPLHAAWHEIIVAARTDADLADRVHGCIGKFEAGLLDATNAILGLEGERAAHIGMVMLSVMHMFDSEANTVATHPNPDIEARRVDWVCALLNEELA